jgi:hypothetical protein
MKQATLKKAQKEILRVLDRYGLTWQQVIFDSEIPLESLDDYSNSKEIEDSFKESISEDKKSKLLDSLPAYTQRLRK